MNKTIVEELKQIVADELDLGLEVDDINENANLIKSNMTIDSLAVVELVYLAEEHFDVEFTDNELTLDNFENLSVFANTIQRKKSINT